MPKFVVERSTIINAPKESVYPIVRDFRKWPLWSPWLRSEPDCHLDFSEDGKRYSWDGKIIGEGNIEIVDESPNESVGLDLVFLRPWKSKAAVRFSFEEEGARTRVTWTMDSSLPFFLFWMKGMMTSFIGMDYDRGLLMLKDLVETGKVPSHLEFLGRQPFQGFSFLGLRTDCRIADIGESMEKDFAILKEKFTESGLTPVAAPFSIYEKWSIGKGQAAYVLGFPVDAEVEAPDGLFKGELPSGETYAIRHEGSYRHLGNAWSALYARVQAKQIKPRKGNFPFEIYENDPDEVSEDETVTTVRMPVV